MGEYSDHEQSWILPPECFENFSLFQDQATYILKSDSSEKQMIGKAKFEFEGEKFIKERICFSAEISSESSNGAGLWLTAKGRGWHLTDCMHNRLLSGTEDWQSEFCVIEIPKDTTYISCGIWMVGSGKALMRNPRVVIVDSSVKLTASKIYYRVDQTHWEER